MKYTRRDFIKTSAAVGAVAGISEFAALHSSHAAAADSPRLETFSDWLKADRDSRKRGLEQCLQRIRELDPSIHAWVQVQPERPTADGPLSEIPFGAKDIIESQGMATEYGSPLYKGRVGTKDAAIIHLMRSRGAIMLGKTVTTAFAYRTPGPTRNPRNLEHTPGGSSSGSAAAVAAGMVPFTIGEQTRGSMIRPASYCGITGFKPTHDLLPMEGVLPLAKTQDTLGLYTHTPADMLALWKALGYPEGSEEQFAIGAPEPIPDCEPEMANAFRQSVALLRRAGINIQTIDIKEILKKVEAANDLITFYEGARVHEARLKEFGDRLDQPIAALVRDGLKIPAEKYNETMRTVSDGRARMSEFFKSTPVILTPAATGPAPLGLSTTGDPAMNAPWTALGTPAITIPMPVAGGLPLGLQLTADLRQDSRVLHAAIRLQERFNAGPKISPA
ncbi:MAG: twin-arginine translocation signal domain-containing protein [Acidobacteriia bacterium]|nr:twin-arginine translocation signal domain-containing protein [Terriglobia bacterium]